MERTPTFRRSGTSRQPCTRKTAVKSGPKNPASKAVKVAYRSEPISTLPLQSTGGINKITEATSSPVLSYNEYLESLQEQLKATQTAQDRWYENGLPSADARATRAARFREIEAERERYVAEEQQLRQEQQRQADILHGVREAAAAEARRVGAENRRRAEEELIRIQLEEIQRREAEAEQRRVAQEEQAAAEELERQTRIAVEEERRRIEAEERAWAEAEEVVRREERSAAAAAAAEERRQREEANRRDCSVCMERFNMDDMIQAPCSHFYCHEHMRDAVDAAYTSRTVFRCCGQVVPADLMQPALPDDQYRRYRDFVLEQTTVNPVYCSNARCGAFVPPSEAQGPDRVVCGRCHRSTCRHCRGGAHDGECLADEASQAARNLARQQGWKACPSCRNMVEKVTGCMHMTCRCGTRFCYRCGQLQGACGDRCGPIYE